MRKYIETVLDGGAYLFHATSHGSARDFLSAGADPSHRTAPVDFGPAFYLNPDVGDAVEWALGR